LAQNAINADSAYIQKLIDSSEDMRSKGKLDSADLIIDEARRLNDKRPVQELDNQIKIHAARFYCARYPNADPKPLFLPVVDLCKKTGDKDEERTAWVWMAACIKENDQTYPFLLTCYENGVRLSVELGDVQDEMYWRRAVARIHYKQHKFELAKSELIPIIRDPTRAGNHLGLEANDLLSVIYIEEAQYDKALSTALETIRVMEATGDSARAVLYYNRLASIYRNLGDHSASLFWVRKALDHAYIMKDYNARFFLISWMATELTAEGKAKDALNYTLTETKWNKPTSVVDKIRIERVLGNCYNALKEYDAAEKHYLEMLQLDKAGKDSLVAEDHADNYSVIGNFYLNTKKYRTAENYLTQVVPYRKPHGSLSVLQNDYLSLFKVDSALGNYKEAIHYLLLHNMLKDSIFTIAKNKQIEELQIKYNAAENEKNLNIAQKNEKLNEIALKHTQNTRNWIIAGSCLLLIIAGLLYRQNGLKQRNNATIIQKNELLQSLVQEKENSNTTITQKNTLLQKLVVEKELLLKELHHRVKNNLYIVMSLLESQSSFLDNSAALAAINESHSRVHAIALIHQRLYGSADALRVEMQAYIPELVNYFVESFNTTKRKILIKYDIDEIGLDVSQAIPVGIILNEAITNSIKYAFDGRRGEIKIVMRAYQENRILLSIKDNGRGMSLNMDPQNLSSLGMTLIKGLTAQLDGEVKINSENGVEIRVDFLKDQNVHFSYENTAEQM